MAQPLSHFNAPPPAPDLLNKKSIRFLLIVLVCVAMPLSLWALAHFTWKKNLEDLHVQLDSRLNLYSSNIVSELEKFEYLPALLARDPVLTALFSPYADEIQMDQANRHLEVIRQTAQVSAVYVMDANGTTLVASNWADETSFVGKNFQFRPYFKKAMTGKIGHYFAFGTTSKIPGYFLSFPIEFDEKIVGVVVVKVSMARLEGNWSKSKEHVAVIDENGIIIIASAPEWKYRSFRQLSLRQIEDLRASRQYSNQHLKSIQIAQQSEIHKNTDRLSIKFPLPRAEDKKEWEEIYLRQKHILGTDWTINYIYRQSQLTDEVISTVLTGCFVWLIIILSILYGLQKRNLTLNRLEYQEQHRRALEQAAVELENQVQRRTYALQQTNNRLEGEVFEREKAEKELRQAQDELVQAGKLAALGEMAAGITHEMNQPLTAIRSYADNAQILIERNREKDAQSNLREISSLCERLGGITGQLKVFSRKTPSDKAPVCLATVIKDTLTLLKNSQKIDGVAIHNTLDNDQDLSQLRVLAEPVRLEQVLLNILRNALEAIENRDKPQIWISVEQKEKRLALHVSDNGPGLKPEHLTRIFDPFFTTKKVGKGLGLGLSISSRIIQDFDGVLKVENMKNGGARFTIELERDLTEKQHG